MYDAFFHSFLHIQKNEICLYYGIVCHINKLQIFPFICTSFWMGFLKRRKRSPEIFYFIAIFISCGLDFGYVGPGHISLIDLCIALWCAVCDNVNSTTLWLMGRIEKSKKMTWPHQHHVKGIELNTEFMYEILFWIGSEIHWFLYLWHVWRPFEIEKDEFNKITGIWRNYRSASHPFEWDVTLSKQQSMEIKEV